MLRQFADGHQPEVHDLRFFVSGNEAFDDPADDLVHFVGVVDLQFVSIGTHEPEWFGVPDVGSSFANDPVDDGLVRTVVFGQVAGVGADVVNAMLLAGLARQLASVGKLAGGSGAASGQRISIGGGLRRCLQAGRRVCCGRASGSWREALRSGLCFSRGRSSSDRIGWQGESTLGVHMIARCGGAGSEEAGGGESANDSRAEKERETSRKVCLSHGGSRLKRRALVVSSTLDRLRTRLYRIDDFRNKSERIASFASSAVSASELAFENCVLDVSHERLASQRNGLD